MVYMRIGFFTDTYLPVTNGVSYVVEILRHDLEAAGHEVWVFAPKDIRWSLPTEHKIIRYPAIGGVLYEDQFNSFFFPPNQVRRIKKLELDVIVAFTPSLIGVLGAYVSKGLGIPYVIQYGTDMEHYSDLYKPTTIAGILASAPLGPYLLKLGLSDTFSYLKGFIITKRKKGESYYRYITRHGLEALHRQAAAVIATSDKIAHNLRQWSIEQNIQTIPTGVDAIPVDANFKEYFSKKYGLKKADQTVLYVGRMSSEKNLELLIDAFEDVALARPNAKLLMVGDFQHRWKLEKKAADTNYRERIIFTGQVKREELGAVYALADLFAFPSLTDCQALVLNEAAHAGLPLVWCDCEDLNLVLRDKVSGLASKNDKADFAAKLIQVLSDDKLAKKLGDGARVLANRSTEAKQTRKLADLLQVVITEHR